MTPPRRFARLASTLLAAALALAGPAAARAQSAAPDLSLWQGERALADIATQLSFGRRAVGTPGHRRTADYIEAELHKDGAELVEQRWTSDASGQPHELVNIIGRLYPAKPRRIILATHYDSIIRAYRDPEHPDAPMPGADNSASGVALLLETARVLKSVKTPPPFGIDFVFFDGEEGPHSLGEGDPDFRPLGSPYFVRHLRDLYPAAGPVKAAVFDMVCYRHEELRPELSSLHYDLAEVTKFWNIGRALGPAFFRMEPMDTPIYDDQTALNDAGIPSFLVIGWNYEPWYNTTQDTLDKCSAAAMNAVGRSLISYIYEP